ncbi:DNA-directed RNA polymerase subunit alpha [Veillonella rodentium]|uniref:DNA-directed RNA polymerase subunit alpha n=1 Tax=Veillonella rodentium TaxID=248315 RepID=A0A239ZP97_9FIRM|nr:DNA-directed RNA polymerase subunit alpha [Veillonella rodentium]SNV72759.1 DNA-directed RNA polymerase subunit alpha [Veillonella rodentium]
MSEEKKLKIEKVDIADGGRYGKFVCEPLDRGYGITLGNSLRRILLSSLDGAAITSIKIDGVLHEFSTIPGIREDVTDIILNLKQLCIKLEEDAQVPLEVHLDFQKDGVLTAGDLAEQFPPEVEVLNPELVIATMDETAHLVMDVVIERGKGYVPSTKNKKDTDVIGCIPIDSIYSPILRAKYEVSDVRVGNEMDFDKLTLEVWTDGSITAADAVAKSAAIMIGYLGNFTKLAHSADVVAVGSADDGIIIGPTDDPVDQPEDEGPAKISIDELELSVRAYNCLKRAGINTIADLLDKTIDDLGKVRNLGKKSIDEIEEKLNNHPGGFRLKQKGE